MRSEAKAVQEPIEELVFLVEEAPEGGYTARALGAATFTEADDMEHLRRQAVEAVHCHVGDTAAKPRLVRLHMVRGEAIQV